MQESKYHLEKSNNSVQKIHIEFVRKFKFEINDIQWSISKQVKENMQECQPSCQFHNNINRHATALRLLSAATSYENCTYSQTTTKVR